jgi:hypothetical protein
MKEASLDQESKVPNPESKLFGLPRPWVGALIGALVFTLILLIFWKKEPVLFSALLYLGNWAVYLLGLSNNAQPTPNAAYDVLTYSIAYVVSCFPPAFLGPLIVSNKEEKRLNGILFLVIYLVFLLFSAIIMAFVFLDY